METLDISFICSSPPCQTFLIRLALLSAAPITVWCPSSVTRSFPHHLRPFIEQFGSIRRLIGVVFDASYGILSESVHKSVQELSEWLLIGMKTYIPHRTYQVKPHSQPWFTQGCHTSEKNGFPFFSPRRWLSSIEWFGSSMEFSDIRENALLKYIFKTYSL